MALNNEELARYWILIERFPLNDEQEKLPPQVKLKILDGKEELEKQELEKQELFIRALHEKTVDNLELFSILLARCNDDSNFKQYVIHLSTDELQQMVSPSGKLPIDEPEFALLTIAVIVVGMCSWWQLGASSTSYPVSCSIQPSRRE